MISESTPARLTKTERYEIRRLAKRVRGISAAEKQALDFISDAQTMKDGVCRKALKSVEDYGHGVRNIQYGLHGRRRKKKDGTVYFEFPGLLARGIVKASGYVNGGRTLGGGGLTPVYTINVDTLLNYVPEVPDDDPLPEKGEPKGEPNDEPLGEPKGGPNEKKGEPLDALVHTSSCSCLPNIPRTPAGNLSTQPRSNRSSHKTICNAAMEPPNTPHAVLPKQTRAASLPSSPTKIVGRIGRSGSLRELSGEERRFEAEPPEDPRVQQLEAKRARKRDQLSYAIQAATDYRELPQSVRDGVKRVSHRCKQEWDYRAFHDEDGNLFEEEDRDLPRFEAPKDDSNLKIAKLLETYGELKIVNAWKEFVNRPRGFDGLGAVWANFFHEFVFYVKPIQADAAGGAA